MCTLIRWRVLYFVPDRLCLGETSEPRQNTFHSGQLRFGRPVLSASIITAYELEKGAKLSRNPSRDLKIVTSTLTELVILEDGSTRRGYIFRHFLRAERKGKLVGGLDILIATTALQPTILLLQPTATLIQSPNSRKSVLLELTGLTTSQRSDFPKTRTLDAIPSCATWCSSLSDLVARRCMR